MTRVLYGHLFSTKTLVCTTFAILNLGLIGAASAQGLSAGTTAPVYGTTWAAAQASSDSLNARIALEPSKAGQVEAP